MAKVIAKGVPFRVDPKLRKRNLKAVRNARKITKTVKIKSKTP